MLHYKLRAMSPNHDKSQLKDEIGRETIREKNDESVENLYYQNEKRYFWDGGLMTNTPLSRLVLLHRYYWYKVRGIKDKIPTLGICVVNVHPQDNQIFLPTTMVL